MATALCDGIFISRCALLDRVQCGQLVAEIHPVSCGFEKSVEHIVADRNGIVLGLRSKAGIRCGNWAVLIAAQEKAE